MFCVCRIAVPQRRGVWHRRDEDGPGGRAVRAPCADSRSSDFHEIDALSPTIWRHMAQRAAAQPLPATVLLPARERTPLHRLEGCGDAFPPSAQQQQAAAAAAAAAR
eukprot:TRINITY_DN2582_c0_g2_i1.p5 TRINITY_DN2582_c0_g2~~TRINITY_DN2582_c0_g2_i1.p5  ORF type:complete len:107 (-),score=22.55 TRINITY_DN2582_c0_g2_i1:722-1042(-)